MHARMVQRSVSKILAVETIDYSQQYKKKNNFQIGKQYSKNVINNYF